MFLKSCGLFRRLFILFFKQKLFGLRDAHWIACTISREFFRVLSVVVGWCGGSIFRVDHFFSNCFCPLRYFYCGSHHLENYFKCVSTIIFQPFQVPMRTRGCAKKFLVEFSENNYRENKGFLGRFLLPDSLFFTQLTFVNFWDLAALRQPLLNSVWLPLTFEMRKFSFLAKFCLKLG